MESNNDYVNYCKTTKKKHISTVITSFTALFQIPISTTQYESKSVLTKNVFKKNNIIKYSYALKTIHFNTFNANLLESFYDLELTKDQYTLSNSIVNGEWLEEMNKYMTNLNILDSLTVHGYTFHGDVIVNNHARNIFTYERLSCYISYHITSKRYFPLFLEFIMYVKDAKNFSSMIKTHVKNIRYTSPISSTYNPKDFEKIINVFTGKKLIQYINNNGDKNPYIDVINMIHDDLLKNKNNIDKNLEKYYTIYYDLLKNILTHVEWKTWTEVIDSYQKRLNNIIKKSPPLKQNTTVLRGITEDYITTATKNSIFRNVSFISTSINYNVAKTFNNNKKCCILKIKLLKGSRALLLNGLSVFSHEAEFLLSSDTNFIINYKKEEPYLPNTNKICIDKNSPEYKSIILYDIVAI